MIEKKKKCFEIHFIQWNVYISSHLTVSSGQSNSDVTYRFYINVPVTPNNWLPIISSIDLTVKFLF